MAKRSSRRLSKKGLFGLRRIVSTKGDNKGKRVWLYHDNEFLTLRDVVLTYRLELLRLLQE